MSPAMLLYTVARALQHLLLRDAVGAELGPQALGHEETHVVGVQPRVRFLLRGGDVGIQDVHLAHVAELGLQAPEVPAHALYHPPPQVEMPAPSKRLERSGAQNLRTFMEILLLPVEEKRDLFCKES